MMKLLTKYGQFLFVIVAILMVYVYSPIKKYESGVNICLIGIGGILSLRYSSVFFSSQNRRIYRVVYGILLLNVIYQFTFGLLSIKTDDWLYLLAKYGTSVILIVSMTANIQFYIKDAYKWLGIAIAIMLLFGIFSAKTDFSGRFTFGFYNANGAGAFAAFVFAVFLIKTDIKFVMRLAGIIMSLSVVMICGSRNAMVMIFIALILKYKFNYKKIIAGAVLLFIVFSILSHYGVKTSSFDRLAGTFTGKVSVDREINQETGMLMFYKKFWTGYGLSAYKIIDKSVWSKQFQEPILGTHNGYICAAKTYGIIGLIFFISIILFRSLYLVKKYFKSKAPDICLHLYVVCSTLIAALAEDYLIGINAFITIVFFTSVSILEYLDYQSKVKNE